MRFRQAIAAIALLTVAFVTPALAGPRYFSFEVSFSDGPLANQSFTGLITVERDDCIPGPFGPCSGQFSPTGPQQLLGIDITVGGVAFTMEDDIDFPDGFPFVELEEGRITQLDYIGEAGGFFLDIASGLVAFGPLDGDPLEESIGTVAQVPEPGTLPLLAAAAVIGVAALRRRRGAAATPAPAM